MAEYPPRINAPKWINAVIVLIVAALIVISSAFYVVSPGKRGVLVTLGKVHQEFAGEGLGFKLPLLTDVRQISVRQQTETVKTECYSSDLQQLRVVMKILYRIPENNVVKIFQQYYGDPFQSLLAPRASEAIKEVTALQSAEQVVKKREEIKFKTLEVTRKKIEDLLVIEDIVIENVDLSAELEKAIENKMVQEQEAAKAKFVQQKAEIEASTAIIKAKGEAEAIRIRGKALEQNPQLIQLQLVEKWNGIAPLVVAPGGGNGGGANIILPLDSVKRR